MGNNSFHITKNAGGTKMSKFKKSIPKTILAITLSLAAVFSPLTSYAANQNDEAVLYLEIINMLTAHDTFAWTTYDHYNYKEPYDDGPFEVWRCYRPYVRAKDRRRRSQCRAVLQNNPRSFCYRLLKAPSLYSSRRASLLPLRLPDEAHQTARQHQYTHRFRQ